MKNYEKIISPIREEINKIDNFLELFLNTKNILSSELTDFVIKKSKKIRSVISALFIKAKFGKITENQLKIFAITEITHNASLIHDDIIDKSEIRRNSPTINKLFGNSAAVIFGDFILSVALKQLCEINDKEITDLFINSMNKICIGELNQQFAKNEVSTMEQYLEKTELKTAELFKTCLVAALKHEKQFEILQIAEEFGKNFGIMFQIKDDLVNFLGTDPSKPLKNDFSEGIYTAPVVFWSQTKNIKSIKPNNFNEIINSDAIEKTNNLINSFNRKNLDLISYLPDNQYKSALIDLCMEVQKG